MRTSTVSVHQIKWIDRQSSEADVLFELEGNLLRAFCHPCEFRDGETADAYLSIIAEEISDRAFWDENWEHKRGIVPAKEERWRYYCFGQIIRLHPLLIDCGILTLPYGDWLNDERVIGCYVYLVVSRLDIRKK